MKPRRRRHRALAMQLAWGLSLPLLGHGPTVFAQALPPAPAPDPSFIVSNIRVEGLQRISEGADFAPRRQDEGVLPPMTHGDRHDTPHAGMQAQKRDETPLRDPINGELRPVGADVGNNRERVDDIAQRRGAHNENRMSQCLARGAD